MPFEQIVKRGGVGAVSGVGVSLIGKDGAMKVRVTIGTDVMESQSWTRGDRLTVLRGTGDDAGKLRLVKAATGGYAIGNGGSQSVTSALCFAAWKGLPEEKQPIRACRHRTLTEGGIEIDLPSWAKPAAKPESPARPDATPATPVSRPAARPEGFVDSVRAAKNRRL